MSQHEINNERGRWVFGWDQPLQSFFLHKHVNDVPEDDNPVLWLGATLETSMHEVDDLVGIAEEHGLFIGPERCAALQGDKNEGR
jgi:hypothetical protein